MRPAPETKKRGKRGGLVAVTGVPETATPAGGEAGGQLGLDKRKLTCCLVTRE